MTGNPSLRLAIGAILRRYRIERGISQAEFAQELGISQPYLSRLEREQRSAVSLALWNKVSQIVGRPELYLVDEYADDLDEQYERALISYGAGDHINAEALFELVGNSDATRSLAAADLVAKSKFWLASIRRDRGELEGETGAEALYRQVLGQYRDRYSAGRVAEVEFVIGACREMAGDYEEALSRYESILTRLSQVKPDRMCTRVNGRIGALTTKLGEYERAAHHLGLSTAMSVHLEDNGPYSYYHEKMAILHTRQGKLDEAYSSLISARQETTQGDALRKVQSLCVESNLLIAQGEVGAAIRTLQDAKLLAEQRDYRHQLAYIENLIQNLESQ